MGVVEANLHDLLLLGHLLLKGNSPCHDNVNIFNQREYHIENLPTKGSTKWGEIDLGVLVHLGARVEIASIDTAPRVGLALMGGRGLEGVKATKGLGATQDNRIEGS
jgi:hypothetical protein